MTRTRDFDFVSELARDLNRGGIALPSFPDVVLRIRKTLEDDDAELRHVRKAISSDAALTSRLLVSANSNYHNPGGNRIESLDVVIARLGFEHIRNTAISLAVEQMFHAEKQTAIAPALKAIWQSSMRRAAMAYALAFQHGHLNEETAFLCGLLHDVGKLYILTKAAKFPDVLGEDAQLCPVLRDWHPKVGKCIVESWKFSDEIANTMDPDECDANPNPVGPTLIDVILVAELLLQDDADDAALLADHSSMARLGMDSEMQHAVMREFNNKLTAVREALTR